MSYFIKVDANRLKQCPNQKQMEALKYTIDFVKTCYLDCHVWFLEIK